MIDAPGNILQFDNFQSRGWKVVRKIQIQDVRWLEQSRILIRGEKAIKLTDQEAKIFSVLWGNLNKKPIKISQLVEAVYADDINGGPLHAEKSLHVRLYKFRRKLAALNLTINAPLGRNNAGYSLKIN